MSDDEAAAAAAAKRADEVRALLEERAGYEARGRDDRVAQVDEALAVYQAAPPKKRSRTRKETT